VCRAEALRFIVVTLAHPACPVEGCGARRRAAIAGGRDRRQPFRLPALLRYNRAVQVPVVELFATG
jgi:hypothetical protein